MTTAQAGTLQTTVGARKDAARTDEGRFLRYIGLLVGYSAASVLLPSFLHFVLFVGLAIYAARGSKETIEAFTLLMVSIIGHGALVPSNAGLFRWVVLMSGFGRLVFDMSRDGNHTSPVVLMFAMTTALLLPINAISSVIPMLSVLKVLAFGIGGITIFGCFERTAHLRGHWQVWFLAMATVLVVGSLIVLPTGMGYTRTVRGYQGILRHPQMLGPVAGVFGAWFTGLLATGRGNPRLLLPLSVSAWALVLLSAARTGALAGGGGFLIALLIGGGFRGQRLISPTYLVSPTAVLAGLLGMAALIAYSEQTTSFLESFVRKNQDSQTAEELFLDARGDRASLSMENFADSPFVGVGFGTPSDYQDYTVKSNHQVGGITIKASSEKGFMPTAVLEETGLIGAVLVLGILLALLGPIHRLAPFEAIWMAWAILLVNAGAAVLFSFGGLGFFVWMMLGYCYNQSGADFLRGARARAIRARS